MTTRTTTSSPFPPRVIFRSKAFDLTWRESHEGENALGKDCAEFLAREFAARGATVTEQPGASLNGWEFVVALGAARYSVFVLLAPLGGHDEVWLVQVAKKVGVVRAIFGPPSSIDEVQPACAILSEVLSDSGVIEDVEWLDAQAFDGLYSRHR